MSYSSDSDEYEHSRNNHRRRNQTRRKYKNETGSDYGSMSETEDEYVGNSDRNRRHRPEHTKEMSKQKRHTNETNRDDRNDRHHGENHPTTPENRTKGEINFRTGIGRWENSLSNTAIITGLVSATVFMAGVFYGLLKSKRN